ncbi:MAG: spherulation-specific family 4 protein [Lysobacterales bacterium]
MKTMVFASTPVRRFAQYVFLCGLLLSPSARALELLVPAYANPCCNDGPAMWSSLVNSAQGHGGNIQIILNPANGPGAVPIDPNYVNALGQGALIDFRSAGGITYGYVPTGFAQRPISEVEADIDTYYSAAYWRGVGVQIQGIFIDEMSNDLAKVPYYQALRDHVHSKSSLARVIGNPGTGFVNNPSQQALFTANDYLLSVDTLMNFEGAGSDYRAGLPSPPWIGSFPSKRFAHVIYAETLPAAMMQDLMLAVQRNAGFVFITDDVLQPNPYDQIPSYWSQQVALARALIWVDGFE